MIYREFKALADLFFGVGNDDVYLTIMRDYYIASYNPNYPNKSVYDTTITYSHMEGAIIIERAKDAAAY